MRLTIGILLGAVSLIAITTQVYTNDSRFRCAGQTPDDFRNEFIHMTSRSEACEREEDCILVLPHWDEDLSIQFLNWTGQQHFQKPVFDAIETVRPVLQDATDLKIFTNFEKAPNTFVVVLNDAVVAAIERGEIEGFGSKDFSQAARKSYGLGGCSGTVYSNIDAKTGYDTIGAATIYVNGNLNADAIDKCTKEELLNALGLVNDPIGQASLFDNKNHQFRDEKIIYSDATLLMLNALYGITRGAFRDIDGFIRARCTG